ncbi:MAG: hypothetical protein K9M10_03920 [Candidatus Pacebacteria bacterium]|nr:hypothetical protein [Candidatus Paceibacterota bacterium]MCF7857595.1 hypothetical protein [Candidatus Paceibacterota bacterium]
MTMSLDELLHRAQAIEVDDETIKKMEERLRQAERKFVTERQLREVDPRGFLEYQYVV